MNFYDCRENANIDQVWYIYALCNSLKRFFFSLNILTIVWNRLYRKTKMSIFVFPSEREDYEKKKPSRETCDHRRKPAVLWSSRWTVRVDEKAELFLAIPTAKLLQNRILHLKGNAAIPVQLRLNGKPIQSRVSWRQTTPTRKQKDFHSRKLT